MIPVSMDEKIDFKDSDGTVWQFKPRTGILEREALFEVANQEKMNARNSEDSIKIMGGFIDRIVVGWSGKCDGKPSDILNYAEQWEVFNLWLSSGRLTVEEKKV